MIYNHEHLVHRIHATSPVYLTDGKVISYHDTHWKSTCSIDTLLPLNQFRTIWKKKQNRREKVKHSYCDYCGNR